MPSPEWTILTLLQWTTAYLDRHGIESARLDAEILLAHALGLKRIDLYLRYDQPLEPPELACFRALLQRRAAREPVAYITGLKAFWDMDLAVTPAVLIPRPETESLVEAVLAFFKEKPIAHPPFLLDLGTGSGAIALALARSFEACFVVALDRSPAALAVARRNVNRWAAQDNVQLVAGDWLAAFSPVRPRFDAIAANPPYIVSRDIATLQPEIADYEPHAALDGGRDGLSSYRTLIPAIGRHLRPGGAAFLEIGCDQKGAVASIAGACGHYAAIDCLPDMGGLPRVLRLQVP
jgi:release factor glutamine methyltransferase